MRPVIALASLAIAGAGCSTGPEGGTESAPPPPPTAQARTPPPPAAPRDACGAWRVQHLVGQPRSEIPVPLDPKRQRVACTTCPITQDFSPTRLNFFFDARTGLIAEIRCG